jgi:hypothetical protein
MVDGVRVKMLTPDEVAVRLEASSEILLLDVRTEEEWEAHHILRAKLIPMHTLRARIADLDHERETIVVCEHGQRSLSVAQYLVTQAGFHNVANMVGGMSEWETERAGERESGRVGDGN